MSCWLSAGASSKGAASPCLGAGRWPHSSPGSGYCCTWGQNNVRKIHRIMILKNVPRRLLASAVSVPGKENKCYLWDKQDNLNGSSLKNNVLFLSKKSDYKVYISNKI